MMFILGMGGGDGWCWREGAVHDRSEMIRRTVKGILDHHLDPAMPSSAYKMLCQYQHQGSKEWMNAYINESILPWSHCSLLWSNGNSDLASVDKVSYGLDNGLPPFRLQAITLTNAGFLSIGNKLQWNFKQITNLFIHKNASENTVCEIAAIFSRGDELTHKTTVIGCLINFDNFKYDNIREITVANRWISAKL